MASIGLLVEMIGWITVFSFLVKALVLVATKIMFGTWHVNEKEKKGED